MCVAGVLCVFVVVVVFLWYLLHDHRPQRDHVSRTRFDYFSWARPGFGKVTRADCPRWASQPLQDSSAE